MKIIPMNCTNCGHTVDVDFDNPCTFCAYCGSKLMLDVEAIQNLLIAKEQTKQNANEQETKQKELMQKQKRFALRKKQS
ncbi:MAG: hypothetical protein IKN14_00505 [Clostridiales bacterium]|nr:hypothetical protein [Clostridiales bacterium]